MTMTVIDTHAHVHGEQFDEDRAAMLERARTAGVERIVAVGCDLEDTRRALAVAAEFGLYATVGIHPHEAKDAPADIAAAFDALRAASPAQVVAVGETGLDYYYNHSPVEDQLRVLRAQLDYARSHDLPVVFHQREAFDDFVAVLRDAWDRTTMRGVIHCFTGDTAQARTFVDEFGMLLGIGGVVTFKTAQPLRDAVAAVGLDALVMETDSPYLAPVPHRGKRNEPAFIVESARTVATVLGGELEHVIATTTANAERFFSLRRPA
jgi:TatD DNase family protein